MSDLAKIRALKGSRYGHKPKHKFTKEELEAMAYARYINDATFRQIGDEMGGKHPQSIKDAVDRYMILLGVEKLKEMS